MIRTGCHGRITVLIIAAFLCLFVLLSSPGTLKARAQGQPQVAPKIGVYITADDIEQARLRVKTEPWAATVANKIISEADYWTLFPDDWFRNMMPPEGSIFAYGVAGCPIDGARWANFGAGGVASFSRPLTLQCPNGEIIHFDDPTSPYYDTGAGVTINGVTYYLRGMWNAFVTSQFAGTGNDDGVVSKLAYAYALTGKPKYARKAMVILDALATVSATTIGPRDFVSRPDEDHGRLHWLTSIVYRARMHLINAYDIVYNSEAFDGISPTNPTQYGTTTNRTIKQNIEENLFLDYVFGEFDLRDGRLPELYNHAADAVRALLGVGMLLGIPEYVTWGLNDIVYFFDNTIDRNGMYHETSLNYSGFTQEIFLDMAELAYHYDPSRYDAPGFPLRSDFPYDANFYDHPKLAQFLVGLRDRVDAAGFQPGYGDSQSSLQRVTASRRVLSDQEWLALEQFYERASDPEKRAQYGALLLEHADNNMNSRRTTARYLFNAADLTRLAGADDLKQQPPSALLGGAGVGILRSGTGAQRLAAVMRGGETHPHGHDDILSLLLYGGGYDWNTEIGYGISGSPLHLGWGTRTIAHNAVVVNQGLRRNFHYFQVGPGADTLAFARFPSLSVMEMDARLMFEPLDNVSQYQRAVWQVDVAPGYGYWLDVFRVTGGRTHDYSFHSRGNLTMAHVDTAPIPGVWTLDGLDNPEATYNAPGRSWGERIVPGETVKDLGIASEGVKSRNWVPAPRNGYGFIYDLKGGQAEDS